MKKEAEETIRSALTPKVTIQACYDVPDGIVAAVRHEYLIPFEGEDFPIPITKLIRVKADKDGKVFKTEGL